MTKLIAFAPYGLDSNVFVELSEIIAIGPSWLRDFDDKAAHVRTLRLRGGSEVEVLDCDENWDKLVTVTAKGGVTAADGGYEKLNFISIYATRRR